MKHLVYILLSNLTTCFCGAADLSLPTNQFLNELFKNPEIRTDFREMWTTTPEASPSRRDPSGGYLFRFQLQFEGNNDTLVFIASDRFGDVRRDAPAWSIYQSTQQNSWRLVSAGEMLQSGEISVHHPSRTIIHSFPDRFDEGKTIVTLKINMSGSTEKKRYRSEDISGDGKETIENEAVPCVLKIEKIPLINYLQSPQTKWRPLSEHGMVAQSLDSGDSFLLDSTSDVAWDEALKLLESLPNPSNRIQSGPLISKPESKAPIPFSGQPLSPKKVTEVKPEPTPSEESTSPTPWSIIIVLIVAVIGMPWFILKMRK